MKNSFKFYHHQSLAGYGLQQDWSRPIPSESLVDQVESELDCLPDDVRKEVQMAQFAEENSPHDDRSL